MGPHMHPRKNGVKLIACQQQVEILPENDLKVSVPTYRSPNREWKSNYILWVKRHLDGEMGNAYSYIYRLR